MGHRIHLLLSVLIATGGAVQSGAQAPPVEWQLSFGGTGEEYLNVVQQTRDGGYILGGQAMSPTNALKSEPNYGFVNFWIIRLNPTGQKLWDHVYGGSAAEYLQTINPLPDGGFLLGGSTRSPESGNKTSPFYGTLTTDDDFWIVRIASDGTKLWDAGFGGTHDDQLQAVVSTKDGGFLLGGFSNSSADGNKTSANYGANDIWIIRVDSSGSKVWEQTYGGSADDRLFELLALDDGGFLLFGYSSSVSDGNKTSPKLGYLDHWLIRVDEHGQKLWDHTFPDGCLGPSHSLKATHDGGYLFGCSFPGSPIHKINGDGILVWQRNYTVPSDSIGVLKFEQARDYGLVLVGAGPGFGEADFWVGRYDQGGRQLWQTNYGGSGYERAHSVAPTRDGGFLIGGWSRSPVDGNKTSPLWGLSDYWVIKLAPEPALKPPVMRILPPTINLFPVPRIFFTGSSNYNYVIESSVDGLSWIGLFTNHATGAEQELTEPGPVRDMAVLPRGSCSVRAPGPLWPNPSRLFLPGTCICSSPAQGNGESEPPP
jgi:hypothetical protein